MQPAGKRKVGRPIAYEGDPNAPHLTVAERRRMRRRVANRESARRVRAKVLNDIVQVQSKVSQHLMFWLLLLRHSWLRAWHSLVKLCQLLLSRQAVVLVQAQQLEQVNVHIGMEMAKMGCQTAQLHGKRLEIEERERCMEAENQRLHADVLKLHALLQARDQRLPL